MAIVHPAKSRMVRLPEITCFVRGRHSFEETITVVKTVLQMNYILHFT